MSVQEVDWLHNAGTSRKVCVKGHININYFFVTCDRAVAKERYDGQ